MNLVIVESPAKCKKLESFLGKGFRVVASMGHFRDLPTKNLGLDLNTMEPEYVISKPDVVKRLQNEGKKAEIIYLCTDPDREGEAISWHLKSIFPESLEFRRATFQEITKKAVIKAVENYGQINQALADAQQARRILDRLVGYKLSPELWKVFKGQSSLSAGRVQSVATRLIIDREREIEAFKDEVYFKIYAFHEKEGIKFRSELIRGIEDKKKKTFKDEEEVKKIIETLKESEFIVKDVTEKKQTKKAQAPFTTSNMQAKAANILKMSASKSMMVAQKLYEAGLITYHRTDSTAISEDALKLVRAHIGAKYGPEYVPKAANKFSNKAGSQEAHECIRPTALENESLNVLNQDELKLYQLIKNQFISSQMSSGSDLVTTITLHADQFIFESKGRVEEFDGYRKLNRTEVQEKSNKKKEEEESEKQALPKCIKGEALKTEKVESKKLKTKPPARFSEASLIKKLEKEGIGRPSTYATIVSTIQKRGYVSLKQRKYYAEDLGKKVTDFLVSHYPNILALDFTRRCESRLDSIGEGEIQFQEFLHKFWDYLKIQLYAPKKVVVNKIVCPKCKKEVKVEESPKFKDKYYYCCHECHCYLEASQSGSIIGKKWITPKDA